MMLGRIFLIGVAALGVLAPAALADMTVTASGTGLASVVPTNPRSDASIKAALAEAQKKAIPRALANARASAETLADAAGLNLGTLTNVTLPGPGNGGFAYAVLGPAGGPFGGSYCRIVRRPVFKRVNGKRKVVRRVRERTCYFPKIVGATVEVTFAATPKP